MESLLRTVFLDEIPPRLIERYLETSPSEMPPLAKPVGLNGNRSKVYAASLRDLGGRREENLALYVHIPFCAVRCHFCACNTNIANNPAKIDDYLETLEREMDLAVQDLGSRRVVRQLHVGGGTPNHLSDDQLTRLMEIVDAHFCVESDACASIECNPRPVSLTQLELLRELGFGRISLGIQDLTPKVQRAIGRVHSTEVIRDVFRMARQAGFASIQTDLIYGLPEQQEDDLARTLEQVVSLSPDRVRCYGYAHTPSLRRHQAVIPEQALPSPAEKITLFQRIAQELIAAGYLWIGYDCFVRPADDWYQALRTGRLRRNSISYTAEHTEHQLAFGPHGLGQVGDLLVQNEPQLPQWKLAVMAGRLPIAWGYQLSDQEYRRRRAYEQLMCNLELPWSLAEQWGVDLAELEGICRDGLLERREGGIRVTPLGRLFLGRLCSLGAASLDWYSAQWHYPVPA